jgi:hypothetical protein
VKLDYLTIRKVENGWQVLTRGPEHGPGYEGRVWIARDEEALGALVKSLVSVAINMEAEAIGVNY